jgi:flagellar motor switch protein FliG
MKNPAADMSPELKAAIVAEFLQRSRTEPNLKLGGEEFHREIEAKLRSEGVPEELIQYMSARHRERALLRPTAALARALFPIERMPDGALPVYYGEPESSKE